MPSISFTPFSVVYTAMRNQNASRPRCTLRTGGGRQSYEEILKDYNVPIDVDAMLRVGDKMVPVIVRSDGTHLSKFVGDKTECRVYLTIGNQCSKIRQMFSTHSAVMVALLLIPIKNPNITEKRMNEQGQTN